MTTVTTYLDLLDHDHTALVAECKRLDDELAAARFKEFEQKARLHVANQRATERRLDREHMDALWGMSMPVVNDVIMGWRR